MKKYIYAVIMILYIGLSVYAMYRASSWMIDKNHSIINSKATDIAILTAKNYKITNAEVEELQKMEFKDSLLHQANIRLADMFSDPYGYDDIKFVYIMVKLNEKQIKYRVTKEYEDFYGAQAGTPLDILWLVDVVVGKTIEEILSEDENYYDDIRRYSYIRAEEEIVFQEKIPTNIIIDDEYGPVISGMAPIYTEEGAFVGMLGVDIYIVNEYASNVRIIRWMLLLVFLLPSVILTAVYILIYTTNLKKTQVTLYTDPLTSVNNRRFMEKYLPNAVKEHHRKQLPLSVIMIDIDHFKAYNDNYGHLQGDKILIEIAMTINSVLRDKTDIICRYGGEEFLVILPNTMFSTAEIIAGRIQSAVNSLAIKHEFSNAADVVTVSQGIYSAVPVNTDYKKAFIEQADTMLYKAKNTGRNKYVSA